MRHMCTCCFGLLWLLVLAGTALLHIVIHRAVPEVQDLPANINTGIGQVFRFDYLKQDATTMQQSSADALRKCTVIAETQCPNYQPGIAPGTSNTKEEREALVNASLNSLSIIQRVASDKYFSTPELRSAGEVLRNFSASLEQANDTMECSKSNEIYCTIFDAGKKLLEKETEIRAEVDRFMETKPVKLIENSSDYFRYCQALPYVLVLAMFFYTCFWCQGGTCCRKDSSGCACCYLVPFAVLWTVFFAIVIALVAGAVGLKVGQGEIRIRYLNGDPSLQQVIEHLKANYPEFWELAFEHLIGRLTGVVGGAAILLVLSLLILTYACCICAIAPYRKDVTN